MSTPLDRALNSRNLFFGFAGAITAAAAWSIWGQDLFPKSLRPQGNPENWTLDEMRQWLLNRGLNPGSEGATREELLAMVKAAQRAPGT